MDRLNVDGAVTLYDATEIVSLGDVIDITGRQLCPLTLVLSPHRHGRI